MVDDFHSSISFDSRMYRQDIRGSIAHAGMLQKQGILGEDEAAAIISGLEGILRDLESGSLAFDPSAEDIHMFIEAELTDRIGAPGKRLHTARSRNDQVALDMRMYLRDETGTVISLVLDTGEKPNLSTRMEEIMNTSGALFDAIVDNKGNVSQGKEDISVETIPEDCVVSLEAKDPEAAKGGKISKAHRDKCGKYLFHGTHRDLDIQSLAVHVCKHRANTDITAPCVYMTRSLAIACLNCVPFMIGHGSKLKDYEEHFVDLDKAVGQDGLIKNVEIVHNDPDLPECSGDRDGYIYYVKKDDCIDDLYYSTPDKPNDWYFVSYKPLPVAKKRKIHVHWHKKYDAAFAKKVKGGFMAVESLQPSDPMDACMTLVDGMVGEMSGQDDGPVDATVAEISLEAIKPDEVMKKKKEIVSRICKVCDIIDPSGLNSKRYHRILDTMSAKEFDEWMGYVRDGRWKLHIVAPNMVVNLKNENILKAADEVGCKLFHKIWMTDILTGRKYLTDNEYLIIQVPVRRQQQFLDEKMSVPDDDRHIDGMTGQVTGDSKSSQVSGPEIHILAARGLTATLEELVNVRGGNMVAYSEFKRQAEENGEIHMNEMDPNTRSRTAVVGQMLLNSMMIDANIL